MSAVKTLFTFWLLLSSAVRKYLATCKFFFFFCLEIYSLRYIRKRISPNHFLIFACLIVVSRSWFIVSDVAADNDDDDDIESLVDDNLINAIDNALNSSPCETDLDRDFAGKYWDLL